MICGLQDDLRQRHETLRSELKELREEKHRIEVELKRLVDMIAAGTALPTVMSAIAEREARIRAITDTLVEPGPDSLQEKLDGLRTFAVEGLTQLRGLLTNPSAIHEARALLAEQVGKFTLERVYDDGKVSFKANGRIDFFGEGVLTQLSGAGGPEQTDRDIRFTIKVAA